MLVSGSAVGWYGLWQDETLTEFDGGKRCFSHRLCEAWEREAKKAQRLGVRVVRLRIGLVLGIEGGMLSRLLLPFELGLGGPIGSGRQWMSWIERDDLVRLIAHIIATPSLTGAGECDRAGAGDERRVCASAGRCAAAAGAASGCRRRSCIISAARSPTNCCSAASASFPTRRS